MSFDDALDRDTQGWKPDVGDKIVGTIVALDQRDSDYGGTYPIVVLRPEPDEGFNVAVHAFHTVLKNELAKLQPLVGERIAIVYRGIPDGRKYENYGVVIDRKPAEVPAPDWKKMRTESDAALGAQYQAGEDEYVPPSDEYGAF